MDSDSLPKNGNKIYLLVSVSVASLLGSVMFAAVFSGYAVKGVTTERQETISESLEISKSFRFLAIEPLLISLGSVADERQLRFEGFLEVDARYHDEVAELMPRIMDALNIYLRAVDYSDVREPTALLKMRLQMLHRVQIVVGEGRVHDLLVSKFLLG